MASAKSELGLINPSLYSLAQSPSVYPKVYHPITFGYIIPWVSQSGYNMATGWGAPNIGEMAHYGAGRRSPVGLGVNVTATENGVQPFDVLPGAVLSIERDDHQRFHPVITGSFNAELDTLTGTLLTVPLSLQLQPADRGWASSPRPRTPRVRVRHGQGELGWSLGDRLREHLRRLSGGLRHALAGRPLRLPSSASTLVANITTLSGESVGAGTFSFSASSYSLSSNTYTKVATLSGSTLGEYRELLERDSPGEPTPTARWSSSGTTESTDTSLS